MANFPTSPAVGEQFSTSKVTYRWNGSAWDIVEGVKQGIIEEYAPGTTDTKLLLHGEAFTDSSLTERTVTNSGATLDSDNKKFGASSMSFNGSNQHVALDGLSDFTTDCTGDFTYDFWVRFETVSQRQGLFSNETYDDIDCELTADNKIFAWFRNPGATGFGGSGIKDDYVTGQWYHIAIIREGSDFKIWVDGVLDNTLSGFTGAIRSRGSELRIGRYHTGYHLHGQIDEFRFQTKAMWTGTDPQTVPTYPYADPELLPVGSLQFTEGSEPDATAGASTLYATSSGMFVKNSSGTISPLVAGASGTATSVELPTITSAPSGIASTGQIVHWDRSAESTPDANVKLLLNAEDTTDSSMSGHTLTFAGNTAISSTKKKFGSTSFYFDGTSDYIDCPDSDDFDFGTGDFTIELWFNTDQTTPDPDDYWRRIFSLKQTGNSGTNLQVAYNTGGTGKLWSWFNDGEYSEYGEAITDGNWHHLAVVRASGTLTIYVDGVSKDSRAYAHNLTGCQPRFGTIGLSPTLGNFEGYMDDIRITKGVAQYTENFDVPTAQLTATTGGGVSGLYYVAPDGTATLIKEDS